MKIRAMLHKAFPLLLAFVLLSSASKAWAQKYKIIHAFAGSDGYLPMGGVVLDGAGNIYGTTYGGGAYLGGTVFELTPGNNGLWTEQQLYSFKCFDFDGCGPKAGVALDASGSLFGTTYSGGSGYNGTVFELTPGANGWTETILYNFNGYPSASGPYAGVTLDSRGNLYGTTMNGGTTGLGTAYELTNGSSGWALSVLHNFRAQNPDDGIFPIAGVLLGKSGNVYGTTNFGGTTGSGIMYELTPMADGTWQEQIYNCVGCGPTETTGVPATDWANSLYGPSAYGGTNMCGGNVYPCGSIWQLKRQANGQITASTPYDFTGSTGSQPTGGVVRDKVGNLYGTTLYGGNFTQPSCGQVGCGVVWELVHGANGGWTYRVLHTFDGSDGNEPYANLTLDGKGNIFGTTQAGGPYYQGVVFEISP